MPHFVFFLLKKVQKKLINVYTFSFCFYINSFCVFITFLIIFLVACLFVVSAPLDRHHKLPDRVLIASTVHYWNIFHIRIMYLNWHHQGTASRQVRVFVVCRVWMQGTCYVFADTTAKFLFVTSSVIFMISFFLSVTFYSGRSFCRAVCHLITAV